MTTHQYSHGQLFPEVEERSARLSITSGEQVPVNPCDLSIRGSNLTVRQMREAQEYNDTLKCGFVLVIAQMPILDIKIRGEGGDTRSIAER